MGQPSHHKDIIVEFVSKNVTECIYIYVNSQNYQKQVSLVTTRTLYLNLQKKTIQNAYIYVNSKNSKNGSV